MSVCFSQPKLLKILRGRLVAPMQRPFVTGVSTDTRTLHKGDLFIPLSGNNFDGQGFVPKAFAKGAALTLVRLKEKKAAARIARLAKKKKRGVIAVADPLKAYGALALAWRRQFMIPVIGVTGSNGKTSTKELLNAVLSQQYATLKTEGNLNNQVGLPRTLLRLKKTDQMAILEMGMNHAGEIRTLARLAQPNVGLITNIGRAHLQGLGTTRAVAKAKGELLQELPSAGLAILNRDDAHYDFLKKLSKARVVTVGIERKAQVQARHVRPVWRGDRPIGTSFELRLKQRKETFFMPLLGRPFVANALMAIAAGLLFSVPLPKIKRALSSFKGVSGRLEVLPFKKFLLVNDSYNANPDSMLASLRIMKDLKTAAPGKKRRLIAVLGSMGELGAFEKKGHLLVGAEAVQNGVDRLITVGQAAAGIAQGALKAGLARSHVFHCSSKEAAVKVLRGLIKPRDLVLIKGSRFMKMEELTKGKF